MLNKDGGNIFRQATNLGSFAFQKGKSTGIGVSDTITAGESVDWFRVRIAGRSSETHGMRFSFFLYDSDAFGEVYRITGNKSAGRFVTRLNGQYELSRRMKIVPGTYLFKVSNPVRETLLEECTYSIDATITYI